MSVKEITRILKPEYFHRFDIFLSTIPRPQSTKILAITLRSINHFEYRSSTEVRKFDNVCTKIVVRNLPHKIVHLGMSET